jgi:hypothetical protein
MRLRRITRMPDRDGMIVEFSSGGVVSTIQQPFPAGWADMSRAEKIAWGKGQIEDHLAGSIYVLPEQVYFPDYSIPEHAKDDFDALPGWATWTGQEAADWIDENVIDLPSARLALTRMAQAIIYLRDVVIER